MRSTASSPGTRMAAALRPFLRLRVRLVFCLLVIGAAARPAGAASLAGRIADPEGRPVPNARVVVMSALGEVAATFTDRAGDFAFPSLPEGRYAVRALVEGFDATPEAVSLSDDDTRRLDIRLRVSALAESVVVSASQVEVTRSEAGASVTVLTAADLKATQAETVADALRRVPGLSVTRSGGRGALTSLFPRGGASNYTLVLVDGIRDNAFGGGYDFGHLSLANVERIEIVRGPQSALYGSEAVGAVVQIVTRRGGPAHLDASIEGGAYGTLRAAMGASGSRGAWSWGLGAERATSDGETGTTAGGARVGNDDDARTQTSGTLAYRRPQGLEATLAASLSRDERGFPGPWGSDPIGVFPGVDLVSRGTNDTRRAGLQVSFPWSARLRQRAEVSYSHADGDFVSSFGPSTSGTRRLGARVQEDGVLARNLTASFGGEFTAERGRSTYVTGVGGRAIPVDRGVLGIFGEGRWAPTARATLVGGVRVERLARQPVEADPAAFSPRPAFPEQTVTSVNPKIAATYRLAGEDARGVATRVRAGAGTGIRPPDVFEIAFTDNPSLQPERSRSVEAGVEQRLAGGRLVVDLAAFANQYDDLIVAVGRALGNASRYRTDNISNARARGLELTGHARLPLGFALAGAFTWLSTEILSVDGLDRTAPPPFEVGQALIRRPRRQGSLDVSYGTSRWSAFASVSSRSRFLDAEPNFGTFGGLFFTPGYTVLDVGGALPLGHGLEVFGRVSNLADRAYEETLGYPALGRAALLGIRVAAGR